MVPLTSIAGYISLLEEPEPDLQAQALVALDGLVDQFWMEIADHGPLIEMLYEDEKFPQRQLAALLLSKVYFHLGEYNEALLFALGAEKLFDLSAKTEFVETIISNCVDRYIASQTQMQEGKAADMQNGDHPMLQNDERLEAVVNRMFERCIEEKQYKQALGVAIEARRSDVIIEVVRKSKDPNVLDYLREMAMEHVRHIQWRDEILGIVARLQRQQKQPDYFAICTCLVHLKDAESAARDLVELTKKGGGNYLIALQIAFDLASSATQEFLQTVQSHLPKQSSSQATTNGEVNDLPSKEIAQLSHILSGEITIGMNLDFLFRSNKTDIVILNKIRDSLEARNSIFHSAVTFANAYMHAGTTIDSFIRENLDWLGRATNWSKFSATAALGVIHRGHLSQGMKLLAPYLPGAGGASSSVYTEGGSLYGLGLIFANHGRSVSKFLLQKLRDANDEVVQHGAALGLGVAGMATADNNTMEALRGKLFNDSAVAGEACGIAMGLIMLGTGNQETIVEMRRYAKETQHEKIIRGLAIGIALLMYGKEDMADTLIETLLDEQEPILRYGGVYTIALAYCGTGNNAAIRKLLKVASNDPNDDVKRVAVLGLGFILFKNHTKAPQIIEVLAESHNANVRYGAALALGVACAGTALVEAIDLLEPMLKDSVDYVRQGVLIAMAMILIQQNEQSCPRVVAFRQTLEKVYSNRHEDALAKFGASLAQGILDAGGRNVTFGLQTPTGSLNMEAIIGIALFTNFWYWYPLAHCLTLAFTPTALIGLNSDLKIPKFDFISNAKPSLFAYPPPTVTKQDRTIEKVDTAVLSTTLKAQLRAKKTEKEKAEKEGADLMDMDNPPIEEDEAEKMETDEKEERAEDGVQKDKKKKKKKEEEPQFEVLSNLSRVVPTQLKYISFPQGTRYAPVKKPTGGVLIMRDLKPEEPVELIEMKVPLESMDESSAETAEEALPPAPFEYYDWNE